MATKPELPDLAVSTDKLTEMVEALSTSLREVGELQARTLALSEKQMALEARADEAALNVESVQAGIVEVNETKVSRDEVRRRSTTLALQVSGVFLMLLVGLSLALVNYTTGKTSAAYTICTQRNVEHSQVLAVLTVTDPAASPLNATQLRNLDRLRDAFKIVDCKGLQ